MFPKPPCTYLCEKNLKRYHFTCLTCRQRLWNAGAMRPPRYMRADIEFSVRYNRNGRYVMPTNARIYTMIINRNQRFYRLKHTIQHVLLTLAEALSN